jgi:hypothetical protein
MSFLLGAKRIRHLTAICFRVLRDAGTERWRSSPFETERISTRVARRCKDQSHDFD